MSAVSAESVRIELVVCEAGLPPQLATQLDHLCETGIIDGYVARAVPSDDYETLSRFSDWAACNGVTFGSGVADDSHNGTPRLPPVAMAEYHDGDLRFVAPCRDRGTVYTVLDRLRDLGQVS